MHFNLALGHFVKIDMHLLRKSVNTIYSTLQVLELLSLTLYATQKIDKNVHFICKL